jgi:redox-sensing transcriptional repressor
MTESRTQSAQPGEPPSDSTVPKVVVSRLSLYLRELQRLEAAGQQTISSGQLGQLLGFSDAQVRKDLGFFGQFGYPGVGYRCDELIRAMRDILGTNHSWSVAMVGVGNLGQALLGYRGFGRQNFAIAAAFDADPAKVGQTVQGLVIQPLDELSTTVRAKGIRLGMIVVPADRAQEAADQLVAAGVEGIVNFAPVTLVLPAHVQNVGVDLAIELEQLSFAVTSKLTKPAGGPPPAAES